MASIVEKDLYFVTSQFQIIFYYLSSFIVADYFYANFDCYYKIQKGKKIIKFSIKVYDYIYNMFGFNIRGVLFFIFWSSCVLGFSIKTQYQKNLAILEQKITGCRFAHQYTTEEIMYNPQPFLADYIKWEKNFMKEVGVQNSTGLTYDGYRIDIDEGTLLEGGLHYWTASSKQSIHVGILANLIWNQDTHTIYTEEQIFEIIRKKTETFQKFYQRFPGFAGFFPWVYLNGTEPTPTYDFESRVPALDNGQLFWAAIALSHAWQNKMPQKYPKLRQQWGQITWKSMIKNCKKVFYNTTTKKIRAVATIENRTKSIEQNQYTNDEYYYLDDPYEGQLFNWIITLFPKNQTNFTQQQIDYIWVDKRKKLQPASYFTSESKQQITVEKGWWFSGHQQWKHLFMPYQDVDYYKQIMQNKQKARTWYSVDKKIAGMFASVTGPAKDNKQNMDYYSDCGIEQISFNKVNHRLMVTPYSAFPLFLTNRTVGATWLHNMLYSPAGQNIYGATEATRIDGIAISPVLTWDSKISTVLAIMGGNADIIRDYLIQNNMYENFRQIIDKEYKLQIPKIKGTLLDYAFPKIKVRKGRKDFPNCKL